MIAHIIKQSFQKLLQYERLPHNPGIPVPEYREFRFQSAPISDYTAAIFTKTILKN